MSLYNKVGDLYHKYVYKHIARGTSALTDSTNYAISDAVLGAALFLPEIVVGVAGNLGYHYIKRGIESGKPPKASEFMGTAIVLGIGALAYGFNLLRTPIERKLQLDIPEELDEENEFSYTIGRLNELANSPKLSFQEVNERVNDVLDSLVMRVEGYEVRHSRKIKMSIFSRYLLRREIGGLMNPFIQEVVMTSEMFPENIAHEKAHLVGYSREYEAQFMGYLAMLNSGDISLKYLAYVQRLDLLVSKHIKSWLESSGVVDAINETDIVRSKLESKGLNKRTLEEFVERREHFRREFAKNSRYRKFLIRIERSVRSGILKLLGQDDISTAYIKKPLKLMAAYDHAQ